MATDLNTVLGSLLNDLGDWVRTNISFGFINMSYILIGIDSLFSQLREVVEFFKPYRARIIPLELLQFRNRLLNSIVIEDSVQFDAEVSFHDFLVGDSTACCVDSTCTSFTSPREYYDCGSYHDIGAVTDIKKEIQITIDDTYRDYLHCPSSDTTGYVISEVLSGNYLLPQTVNIPTDSTSMVISIDADSTASILDYSVLLNIYNEQDTNPDIIPYVITDKSYSSFEVTFSNTFSSENYYLTWNIYDSTGIFGIESIPDGSSEVSIIFSTPMINPNYSISYTLENLVDSDSSFFFSTVIEKSVNGFTIKLSGEVPTGNYSISWAAFEYGRTTSALTTQDGLTQIPYNSNTVTVPFDVPYELYNNYNLALSIINLDDTSASNLGYIVRSKDLYGFTLQLSDFTDSTNYYLSWVITINANLFVGEDFLYRQTGQFRNFDDEGSFDCTHGFDQCDIFVEDVINFLLQENGDFLLQENGDRIIL